MIAACGRLSGFTGAARTELLRCVGSHEILPVGGRETARWWPTVLPTGGQWFCPR